MPSRLGEGSLPQTAEGGEEAAFVQTKTLKATCKGSLYALLIGVGLLTVIGLCMLLSVSGALRFGSQASDKYALVKEQGLALVVGVVAAWVLSRVNYRRLRKLSVFFVATVCLLLVVIHVPGVAASSGGAASWINLGFFTLQPSELAKLALVLCGSYFLADVARAKTRAHNVLLAKSRNTSFLWPFGVVSLVVFGLVVFEPDVGTALIIAGLSLGLLWLAGMPIRAWFVLVGVCTTLAVGVVVGAGNRLSRLTNFLDPGRDPLGAGFQLNQSLIALGRGGFFGVGPGQSVQKFAYLPQAHTDMVFSVLGEEFGFLGTLIVIGLYAAIAFSCWRLARCCLDPCGRLLLAGCGMLIVLQAIINIGGATGTLPLTGVPLPFMSYGRNNLLVMFAALGIIMSVVRVAPACTHKLTTEDTRPKDSESVEFSNVTYLDRWRRHRWPRGTRPGRG